MVGSPFDLNIGSIIWQLDRTYLIDFESCLETVETDSREISYRPLQGLSRPRFLFCEKEVFPCLFDQLKKFYSCRANKCREG